MAESGKGDKEDFNNTQSVHINPSVDSLENYVHNSNNSKEFIDIHRDHRKERATCPGNSCVNISESLASTVNTDTNVTLATSNSKTLTSPDVSQVIQNSKVPVQVSEEGYEHDNSGMKAKSNNDSSDVKPKSNADNSDDEYQSADDGDGNVNKNSYSEEDSEDEFIPLGDDNDYSVDQDEGNAFCRNANASIPDENEEDELEEQDKESNIIDDLEVRKTLEEKLTEEERQERKESSQKLKDSGNAKFRTGDYDDAISAYTEALDICPLIFVKERSIMFANRAACKMKKELYEGAIEDSTSALDLHPHYLKALLRRAELFEKTTKLDEALKDYQKVMELDPSNGLARAACMKLAEQIKDRNEKMKEEMIGKLKDLGNLVLRPFGLSVNNFNLQKDPNTGSYSVQFQQTPPTNGS